MKGKIFVWIFGIIATGMSNQCKTPVPGPDLNGIWKAQEVKEGSILVYRAGASDNIYSGYRNYRMQFGVSNIEFTELSGEKFTGNWELGATNDKLIFRELVPIPYGTGGTIEFTLIHWEANKLVLRRETPNLKTGGSLNEYIMIPE